MGDHSGVEHQQQVVLQLEETFLLSVCKGYGVIVTLDSVYTKFLLKLTDTYMAAVLMYLFKLFVATVNCIVAMTAVHYIYSKLPSQQLSDLPYSLNCNHSGSCSNLHVQNHLISHYSYCGAVMIN